MQIWSSNFAASSNPEFKGSKGREWLQFCCDFVKSPGMMKWLCNIFFFLTAAQEFFSITFVLHAIFFFRQALAGNFFQNHPPPPQELNGQPLIRLRTFVWVKFKQKASFVNWTCAKRKEHLYKGRPNFINEKQIAFVLKPRTF